MRKVTAEDIERARRAYVAAVETGYQPLYVMARGLLESLVARAKEQS